MEKKQIIVLGASQTALSTLRCLIDLRKEGVKIILAYQKVKYKLAAFSNIAYEKIIIQEEDWAEGLLNIKDRFSNKPVLLFTQDDQIVSVSKISDKLKGYYLFLLPNEGLVTTLMEKDKFTTYAIQHKLSIPSTKIIHSRKELLQIDNDFYFPIIIKPYLMHALIARDKNDLNNIALSLAEVNLKSLIAQRFIEGDDDQLYFCFLLFDENSNVINHMLAQKLRQWPINSGTTSLAKTIDNNKLVDKSIKIFKKMNYTGFCSIEYKYDKQNDNFVIMEPTVGRFNQQVALTGACEINFPESFARLLFGEQIKSETYKHNQFWMFESNDFFSFIKNRKYGLVSNYFKSNYKVLFNIYDPIPFLYEWFYMVKSKIKKTIRSNKPL